MIRQLVLCLQTMMKKQKEMLGSGGSLGCLSLVVSSDFTHAHVEKTQRLTLIFVCF